MKLKHLESLLEAVPGFASPVVEWEQYPTPPHLAAQILFTIQNKYNDIQGKAIGDLGVGCGILTIAAALLGSSYNFCVDIDAAAVERARLNCAEHDIRPDFLVIDVVDMTNQFILPTIGKEEEEIFHATRNAKRGGRQDKGNGRMQSGRGKRRGKKNFDNSTTLREKRTSRVQGSESINVNEEDEEDVDKSNEEEKENSEEKIQEEDENQSVPLYSNSALSLHSASLTCIPSSFSPPPLLDTVITNPPFGTRRAGIDVLFVHVALQLSLHSVYSFHKSTTRSYIQKIAKEWGVECEIVAEMKFDLKKSYSFHRQENREVQVDLIRFAFAKEKERPERFRQRKTK